ncbi:unnamed protein product [Phytophthora lilii]|uniref:Unnamed protein product n=1 Tax=Phytophthora lilii TaxID=2077276 RepID=A0A9W6WNY4_9STRA|nr:unnamed protein product [Phytophthora lilii]
MLNPDGVINGNTRVSLAGWDLNRKWSNPIEQLFPTVYHLKQQLAHFQTRGRVAIYCDLHGHSINRNIFTYGCYSSKKKLSGSDGPKASATATTDGGTTTSNSNSINAASSIVKTDPRVFPMIVARHAPCFSFTSCDFSVHKSKLTTARVVVNQELGVTNSYTLEASFCGPDFGVHKDTQFSTWNLEEMGRSWCQSLLVYYGLTAQVKALDAERARQASGSEQIQSVSDMPSPTGRQTLPTRTENGLLRTEAEDEESRLARDLLLDCEAAISALFAHTGTDVNDRIGSEDDIGAMDSDLSGAEEEPIPPSPQGATQQRSPQVHSERKKQRDDDDRGADNEEGYSSAPDEFPVRKMSNGHNRKKASRRKHSRGSVSSKPKPAVISTSRKSETKSKKKKKRKSKSELRRTSLTTAAPSQGPKLEDAEFLTLPEPLDIPVVSSMNSEPAVKIFPKKATTARHSKSKNGRPKSSYEPPRSIASAILQATINVDYTSSRASLRLRPMPEYPSTSSPTLLVLPSVLDNSNRGGNVIPRILKTAPAYDQDCPAIEEKGRFNLSRVRSELPALQHSGRDEEQQRHTLHQYYRVQENDDIRSDEASDESSDRSEPEAYASSF